MRPSTNLPVELTSFVGRRADIERVSALLSSSRLINLTGPGGVGKTRLAIQSALAATPAFPDGVWFIDLTSTSNGDVVPSLVAAPLEVGAVDTSSARELTDVLADYMADKELLLLLDNCEHVLEAVQAFVPSILTRCLDVRVLATGRETLGLEGENVVRVAPLPVESTAPGEHPDAVRLFLDRASQVRADYRPEGDALDAIEDIVRRLDGLPLAIELAASRTKLLSPEQILDRLADRFRFLKGDPSRPDRHETLQATIDWSYGLLDSKEQEALQRLAVFSGWSLEAAEAALGKSSSTMLLGGLVDKSLVDVVPRSPANRYRILEMVRQYALEQLAGTGGEDGARAAHAEYFLDLAEQSDVALRGPDQAQWVEKIKADHDNIRSALGWALAGGRIETALRIVAAMGRFWFMQTHWNEAMGWFARVSERAGDEHAVLWARAFLNTGAIELITRGVSEPDAAERAHRILSEHGEIREVAMATYALAEVKQGTSDESELINEAIRLFEEADDAWGRAYAQRWQGSKIELHGDPMENIAHEREGVEGFTRLGDRWSAGWLAFDLGYSLLAVGRFEEANQAFENAIDLVSEIDDRLVAAHAARGMASVAAGVGRLDEARRRFREAIPLFEQIGDENCLAFSHMYLADVDSQLDQTDDVANLLETAIRGFTSVDNRPGIAAALRRLARRAIASGDPDLAAKLLGAADLSEPAGEKLSPPEQALHDEVETLLEGELATDELRALRAQGARAPVGELLAAVRLHLIESDAAPVGLPPEPQRTAMWPSEYDDLRRHVTAAWQVEGEILVHRGLGGKSGATVLAVDLKCSEFSGQAILKLERVDEPSPGPTEADRHHLAFDGAPEFAGDHLPRIVHSTGVNETTALLSTIAGRGLEYTLPWAESPYAAQLDVGRRVIREILERWNAEYRLADSILTPQEVLGGWLDYRLDPTRGRIHEFLEEARVDPGTATVMWDGHWYPNPLAFAIGAAPGPTSLGLRPAAGHTHGDLHGYNVLIRTRDGDVDWFLIDLAFYDPDAFLFFDHAYFEISHLLETRSEEPVEKWMPLLAALAGRDQPAGDDVGLVGLLRELRTEASSWIEATEPDRLSYMESQMILARVAVGLNFTHKRVPARLKRRGFLYAMSSLKEYLKFHGVEWPRTAESLVLET